MNMRDVRQFLARRATWFRATRETGNVASAAILAPVTFLIFFILLQTAWYYHARHIATGAAEESLKQAASQYGNVGTGTAAGYAFVAAVGPGTLQAPVIAVSRGPAMATVEIIGKSPTVVPFWHPVVTVRMERPVERITIPGVPS